MDTQPIVPAFRFESESAPFPRGSRMPDTDVRLRPLKNATRKPPRPVLPATQVRATVVRDNDLRNQIGFQNDLNTLLAALDMGGAPFGCAAPLLSRQWHVARPIETELSEADTSPELEAVNWTNHRKTQLGS